jgi:hypothetical protein
MKGTKGWQKGQSGNPGGRPKGLGRIRDIAQKHTELAMETLKDICKNGESETARVQAATALLDRGWGKPAQSVDITNSDGSMSQAWLAAMKEVDNGAEEQHVEH